MVHSKIAVVVWWRIGLLMDASYEGLIVTFNGLCVVDYMLLMIGVS